MRVSRKSAYQWHQALAGERGVWR
ncbi:hypothetical protein ACIBBD_35020 [Streptomyces sp. NPDC051315]